MTAADAMRSARPAHQILREAGIEIASRLRQAVDGLSPQLRHLVGMHFGWWDRDGAELVANTGKGVRAALALLACEAVGGCRTAAVPTAVAVELVHNASLLHDDIIDGDRERRGRPALWAQCGLPAGILAGDALFFLAVQVLHDAPCPVGLSGAGRLTAAVQRLVDGEYSDTLLETQLTATVAECMAMAAGKTGALFTAACELGALAGGASEERAAHLGAFGEHVGLAFQLVDDVLGIWGDPRQTGKPVWSDLAQRKKSFPVAVALDSDGPPGQVLARLYSQAGPHSPSELSRAADLVEEAGGREWALQEAERRVQAALGHLQAALPATTPAAELETLARFGAARDC